MLNTAVCDDNPIHLEKAAAMARRFLAKTGKQFKITRFDSAESMLDHMESNEWQPDIAVLDIEMDGENGISLARKLNEAAPACRIIFLTAYVDHAPEAYLAEHIWFVVKSRAEEFFEAAMEKAVTSIDEGNISIPVIIVRNNGKKTLVPIDTILYIGKVGRKAHVHCVDSDYYDTRRPALLIPENLEGNFIQCHQGYWVNSARIKEIDRNEFVLQGGERVPVSRTFRDDARKRFFDQMRITFNS